MNSFLRWHPYRRRWLNGVITVGSVGLCLLLLPTRPLGMELSGIGPHWLLIWVVAWSVKRTAWQGIVAGVVLGFLQDGLTAHHPTHALGLALVGYLTARLQKQRYTQEDFISIALIVFGMSLMTETVMAVQFSLQASEGDFAQIYPLLQQVWLRHQQVALSSAILSSLWAPVLYYPLNRWWQWCQEQELSTNL